MPLRRCNGFEAKSTKHIQWPARPRGYTAGTSVCFRAIAYAVALFVSAGRSRIKPSAYRVIASVCFPRALHWRYTQQRFVRRRILPRRHSALEAYAPYASKARQRSRTCSASAILHRCPTFLFLRPYSLWAGDSSRDSYWKPSAKGACAHGPRSGMPPSHEGGIEHGRQS